MTGYTARLMAAYASGLIAPGDLAIANVEHDSTCPALRGRACTCIPAITVTTSTGVIHVEADGSTRKEVRQ